VPLIVCVAAPRVEHIVILRCVAGFCELRELIAAAGAEMEADLVGGVCQGVLGCAKLSGGFEQLVLCVY
jgi:hypothetical protein